MRALACVLACLLLTSCASSYESVYYNAPLKVVVVVGQSNCVNAHAKAEELPRRLQKEQESLFYSEGWTYLSPTVEEHFGPEISLAWHLSKAHNEPIGIIKHAVGGTNLAEDWFPRSGECYDDLMQKIDSARNDKYEFEIIAVCWMQGERDAKFEDMAYAYSDNLETLITCLRADCENPELRFVAGRITPPIETYPYVDVVRMAIENYAWVDCDDLSKDDLTHYDTDGVVELGRRFAEVIWTTN